MRAAPSYDVRAARGAPPARPSPTFRTLVRLEVSRAFRLKRPWIGLAVLGLIPVLLTLSLDLTSNKPGQGDGPPFLYESLANGLFIPFASLEILIDILLPAVVALVAADALAGETASGTLRALLARPVTRWSVLLSKWVLSAIYAALGLLVMGGVSLLVGGLVFGIHEVNTVIYGVVSVPRGFAALGLAYAFGLVCMLGVIGIALTISTWTASPIGAFFGTVAVIAVENILKVLPSFQSIQPALITGHFATWRKVVQEPPDYDAYLRGLIVPAIYAAVGLAIAWWSFRRRDVLA